MRARKAAAIAAAMFAMAYATPASAQRYKFDFGVNGGGSWYSKSLSGSDVGATSGGDVGFKPSWLVGSQFTFHFMPRLGLRLNGTYNDGQFEQHITSGTNTELFDHINMWSGSADLMFGFKAPRETWSGMEILPYLALGGGIKWTNPAGDTYSINDTGENKSWNGFPFTCFNGTCSGPSTTPPGGLAIGTTSTFTSTPGQQAYFFGEANSPMGLVGLGTDIRVAPSFAIRLEVGDRIWKAPIVQANAPLLASGYPFTVTTSSDKIVGNMVNEVYLQAGLHMLFGLQRVATVAVVAPAPPPPPPAPTPAPVIEERATQVCVVDATNPAGLRVVDATFVPSTNETYVMQNGNRVTVTTAFGSAPVASSADWFVQGQPLTLSIGPTGKAQYTTYGSSRMINASDLGYLGTVHGLPVYADRDDIKDVQHQLDELRSAQSNGDLNDILNQQKDLQKRLDTMKVVYVPLQPTGCVFQAMQRVEEVRKNR